MNNKTESGECESEKPGLSAKVRTELKIGGRYRHFKGKEYIVLHLAKDSETLEEIVVYKALYGDFGIWARPLEMFCEQVEAGGKMVRRFEEIGE